MNFKTIAIVRRYDETHKAQPIAERASALGLTLTLYIYYLDKFANILLNASSREAELLRSQYTRIIHQSTFDIMAKEETKRHRATKYDTDVKCAQCYHTYLLGKQTDEREFWYFVERHNELYGNDAHYTAIFNGNNNRVKSLIQLRGEKAYRCAP